MIEGYGERLRDERLALTYHARLAEGLRRWPRNKSLPSFEEMMSEKEDTTSPAGMLAAFQEHAARGAPIKIKKVSKGKVAPRSK